MLDSAKRLLNEVKQRYLDFLPDRFTSTNEPTFQSLMDFADILLMSKVQHDVHRLDKDSRLLIKYGRRMLDRVRGQNLRSTNLTA